MTEQRVIELTLEGYSNKEIAEITGLTVKKIHEINHEIRAEMYLEKVEKAKQLRKEGNSHRKIAKMMNISSGSAYLYTNDTRKETFIPSDMREFKKEWNAVCRRLNPKAWEDRKDE